MDDFRNLLNIVLDRQTQLAKVYRDFGGQSLSAYVGNWTKPPSVGVGNDLLTEFTGLAKDIYPDSLAKLASTELADSALVSTIDHHGLLNHPFFVNSNLIYCLRRPKCLIVLPTAGISLNNSSFPGCLLLTDSQRNMRRLPLFADRLKNRAILALPQISEKEIESFFSKIGKLDWLHQANQERLHKLVSKIFEQPEIIKQTSFSRQACLISSRLWQEIFPGSPPLVYLPLEELVGRILFKRVASDSEHLLHRLFFDMQGWGLLKKYFDGNKGAFSGQNKGSFLFWGLAPNGRRIALWPKGSCLVGQGLGEFGPNAAAFAQGLADGSLYPTSLVCFLVLLYYGLGAIGGFNQINWLTDIKQKFVALLEELGEEKLSSNISIAPTTNFAEGNLAFLRQGHELIKPTGIDLYLSGRDYFPIYQELAKKITVAQSIETLLPEIYRVIIPQEQRQEKLLRLTDIGIARTNGLAESLTKHLPLL